jgi:hypothetical protein
MFGSVSPGRTVMSRWTGRFRGAHSLTCHAVWVAYAAGPHQFPDRIPAWYVFTLDAVVLAGPFSAEAGARTAGARLAMRMAEAMRRDGGPAGPADIQARVGRLRVGFGVRPPPDGRFEASPEIVAADPADCTARPAS